MKLKLPLILLGAVLAATAQATANVTFDNSNPGHANVTVNGGDLSSYFMYGTHASAPDGGYGIIGAAASYQDTEDNAAYEKFDTATVTMKDGTGLEYLTGLGVPGNAVEGKVTINMEGGDVKTIVGGIHYGSNKNRVQDPNINKLLTDPGYGHNSFGYRSDQKGTQDIEINVTGGTVGQIRGTHNGHSSSGIYLTYLPKVIAAGQDAVNKFYDNNPASINGSVSIKVDGGTVGGLPGETAAIQGGGGSGFSVDEKVNITIQETDPLKKTTIKGDIIAGSSSDYTFVGATNTTISGGTIDGNVYGGGDGSGSKLGGPTAKVKKGTSISISDGTINGNVYGAGIKDEVTEDTSIVITGGDIDGDVYGGGTEGSKVGGNTSIELLGGNISGTVSGYSEGDTDGSSVDGTTTLKVGSAEQAYTGSVGSIGNFSQIIVAQGSSLSVNNGNIFAVKHHDITLSALNLTQAAISASTADVEGAITLNIGSAGKLESGKYMVIQTEEPVSGWSADTVSVSGIAGFEDLQWQGNVLYFIYRGSNVDALAAANWGVFKSSQAFVNTLRGPRTNAITLDPYGKGGKQLITCVWGTVYGHSSRIGSNGADYTLWGGALGAERALSRGRTIGAAIGYDWGKAKPFTTSAVDQETFHLGLYGRAWHKKLNSTDSVALDWSAAYGNTCKHPYTGNTDAVSNTGNVPIIPDTHP
ncbi:MAG: autotransporter domain-containing protein [Akkermansia sp.]|nr:autotransporter domain-containing protein [Akkermansia sp.]